MLNQHDSELLSAYADHELSGDELAAVQNNLAASAEWREELERLQKTKQLAMALPRVPAPADLLDFLEEHVQRRMEKPRFRFWKIFALPRIHSWAWNTSAAVAALSLLTVGVHHVHQNAFMPLEPFLAAHSYGYTDSLFHQNVVTASVNSLELRTHVAK